MPRQRRNPQNARVRKDEEGAILIIVALSFTALLGFGALALDSGYQVLLRTELQNVADAAAHGGALGLDLTEEGLSNALGAATEVAGLNRVGNQPYVLESDEFEIGTWDFSGRTFTPNASDPESVNAVRVTPSYAVQPLAMDILKPEILLRGKTSATAARLPVSGGCAFPIAVPSCRFDGMRATDICGMDLVFNADGVDSAGWASLGTRSPNASTIRTEIADAIDGECSISGDSDIDSDPITLNNGAVANAIKELVTAIETSPTYWDSAKMGSLPVRDPKSSIRWNRYGSTLEGLIYVYEDPYDCRGTRFTGQVELSGYAQVVFYDVVNSGSVSQRKIKARVSCESKPGNPGSTSAGFYGTLGSVAIVE